LPVGRDEPFILDRS
jgi:hypothetical protein